MLTVTPNPLHLGQGCIQVSCNLDVDQYDESWPDQYGIALPENLARAVPKRKAEFIAGRYCASAALVQLSAQDNGAREIPIGENRQPHWPAGIVGSITHSKGYASAVVAQQSNIRSIGIDSESIIPSKTANNVSSHILVDTETFEANTAIFDDFEHYLTMVFSAKESIFKCLYPMVNKFFEFAAAEICVDSTKPGHFRYKLRKELTQEFHEGYEGTGIYRQEGDYVHTAIILQHSS